MIDSVKIVISQGPAEISPAHTYARARANRPSRWSIIRRSSKPIPAIPGSSAGRGDGRLRRSRLQKAQMAAVQLVVLAHHVALVVVLAHAFAQRAAHLHAQLLV